ncbi:MAG: aminopeptidase [Deltaproteobacteria bacterium]|nr:aminopeptidase [Deltaproteobacteria bacterium]MBW2220164.1 aminopeptidase [Deltaproteobacteria bacterium]
MLTEKQLQKYADVLLWGLKTARTGKEKKNDIILIRYSLPAIRLAEILQKKILETGRNPVLRSGMTPVMEKQFYKISNTPQLVFQPPGEKDLYRNINGSIFLHAPESITHLSDVDPARIGRTAVARKNLKEILDKRESFGDFGWTLCVFPTSELARHAGLTLEDYSKQIARACFIDRKDPVSLWQDVYKKATYIKKRLNNIKINKFHIESENIDLEITPGEKRRWIGISGHNIPSFELFMSPDWRGTNGIYYADQPSYRTGNYVKGVRLEFKNGTVVNAKAEEGEAFLKKQLLMDKGASRLGEFSLTDKNFSKINRFMANTLFDENYGGKYGNCHVALGSSYADTYDGNQRTLTKERKEKLGFNDSALHWDIVNTEKKRVTAHLASGITMVIYENGKFV